MFDGATSKCSANVSSLATPRRTKSANFVPHPAYYGKVRRRRAPPAARNAAATESSSTVTGVEASGSNLSVSETTRVAELLQQIPSTGKVVYATRSKSGSRAYHNVSKRPSSIVSRLLQLQDNPAAGHDSEAMDSEAPDPGHQAFPPPTIPPPSMPLPVAAAPIPPPARRPRPPSMGQADINKDRRSC